MGWFQSPNSNSELAQLQPCGLTHTPRLARQTHTAVAAASDLTKWCGNDVGRLGWYPIGLGNSWMFNS